MIGVGVMVDIDQCAQFRLQSLLEFFAAAFLRDPQGLLELSKLN